MNPPLRVAVIGVGFGQQVHVPAFRADSRCEVTTLCASNEAKAAEIATRLNVPHASGDWRAVVADPEIDAVSIAVPPRLQPQIALEALEHGKSVFCEKPLGAHLHDVMPLRRSNNLSPTLSPVPHETGTSSARRAVGMVNFEFCECDAWQRFQQMATATQSGRDDARWTINWRVQTYSKQAPHRQLEIASGRGRRRTARIRCTLVLSARATVRAHLPSSGTAHPGSRRSPQRRDGCRFGIRIPLGRARKRSHRDRRTSTASASNRLDRAGHILRLLNEGSDYIRGFELFSGFGRATTHSSEFSRGRAIAGDPFGGGRDRGRRTGWPDRSHFAARAEIHRRRLGRKSRPS